LAYRTLQDSLWDAPEWCSVDAGPPSPRLLLLYLAVGPLQRSVPGVVRVGEGELADRLGWTVDAVRDCMKALLDAGSLQFDRAQRLVWLPWKYDHEVPSNPNQVRGWATTFERWPSGELATQVRKELRARLESRGPQFVAAFDLLPGKHQDPTKGTVPPNRIPEPLPATVLQNGSPELFPGTVGGNISESVNQRISEKKKDLAQGSAAQTPGAVQASTENPKGKLIGRTVPTRDAYEAAYEKRYNARPPRSESINGKLAQFIKRVGYENAPAIASFYVSHKAARYTKEMHPVGLLLKDAEKLHTEWSTGRQMTDTEAYQQERTAAARTGAQPGASMHIDPTAHLVPGRKFIGDRAGSGASIHISEESKREAETPGRKFL
jgi:hypothetical protein